MKSIFPLLLIFSIIISCNNPHPAIAENKELVLLDDHDKKVCDSISFDTIVLSKIRNQTDNLFSVLHRNPELSVDSAQFAHENKTLFPGLSFNEKADNAEQMIVSLGDDLSKKGYIIFISEQNFGIENMPDQVGVLKTKDQYDVLKFQQTNGANYNIDTDSLIQLVKTFDSKYSLQLDGAGPDWCQFKINKAPSDWLVMAKEVYAVCPDVVDQGTETVEKLAEELQRTKTLYFWWD